MDATSSSEEGPRGASVSESRPAGGRQRFGKADRILRSKDFERIYRHGHRLTSPSFAIFALPNDVGRSRLGMTVTRKFGNSVVRNRYKRIVREIFRKNRSGFGPMDYVVNIRSAARGRAYAVLARELLGTVSASHRR